MGYEEDCHSQNIDRVPQAITPAEVDQEAKKTHQWL